MALSKLSGDEQGIILGQLRNTLEPRLVMYFSSASKELRALLTPAVQQQLRADYEEATALCVKVGMQGCKELREATQVEWKDKGLSAADLATLAKLGSVLPALEGLWLIGRSGSAGLDGVLRLAEGLVAGALPALTELFIGRMHVGDAGAAALAAALDRGALPRLRILYLTNAGIGDAALAALAPALRRRPALERLDLGGNPLGDAGLAALVAPPPPAGTPPPPAGGLKQLELLDLDYTEVTAAGCATLAAVLDSDVLPALEELELIGIPASVAARDAVSEALAKLVMRRGAQPLPGGYKVGEKVFFTGWSQTLSSGKKLAHGQQGEVVGPASSESSKGKGVKVLFAGNKGVKVLFAGNKGWVCCPLTQVSRDPPPPLPGGYTAGDQVFYTGASETFPIGDKVVHGQQGEVVGPATLETHKGKGVAVIFPGNKGRVDCYLDMVSRDPPPPLPGGYTAGDQVFYTGASETFPSGKKVVHGQQGEVTGPATSETHKGKRVAVLFPGNKGHVNCLPTQVSRDPPPPLPGGYKVGEKVFFTGASETLSSGEKLAHGQQGEVVGPASSESHKGKGVAVLFPGNKKRIDCDITSVSHDAPPAWRVRLPGASADQEEVAQMWLVASIVKVSHDAGGDHY